MINVKVDPFFGMELKEILPSNLETIKSEITKPSPIPFVFIYSVSLTKPNSLKSLFYSFCGIPTPVSMTDISKYVESCDSVESMILTLISTFPTSVNLRALDWRPNRTYIIRCLSDTITELNFFLPACSTGSLSYSEDS